jgi:Big-like domain-containing protein/calcineurin-like phosphoesterase family protein
MVSRTRGMVGALAATGFLLLGVLLAGLVVPSTVAQAVPSQPAHLQVHPDGHVSRHDPATGQAIDLRISSSPPIVPLAGAPFSFVAAGDFAFGSSALAVMSAMGSSGAPFALVLGDMSYGDTSEANWCNTFESAMGDGHVLIVSGNHDTGDIDTYAANCNYGIGPTMTGQYGHNYWFDYAGLARFIATTQGTSGGDQTGFVSGAIDGARAAGIPWVIVYMHKNCITDGTKDCEIGQGFSDMLLSKRVDLILQGHEHNYLRSHQLSCGTHGTFRSECVADTDGTFQQGAGSVINIVGTGGQGERSIGGTSDAGYFATLDDTTHGYLRVDVSSGALSVNFHGVDGGFTDGYQVVRGASTPTPDFSVSASPTSVSFVRGQSAPTTIQVQPKDGYTGTINLGVSSSPAGIDGSCSPASLQGGGTSSCVLGGSASGQYTVTITGTSGSLVHSTPISVQVNDPAPGPDTTPPSITIASPSGETTLDSSPITLRGYAADDVALEKVEWKADGGGWTVASGTNSWSAVVTLAPGPHTITVRATDTAANQQVATISFVVRSTPTNPVDTIPRLFGMRLVPTVLGIAAGIVGLVVAIALAARARRGPRADEERRPRQR